MKNKIYNTLKAILVVFIVFFITWLYAADFGQDKDLRYGVTFSQKYASELNLNWQEVYVSIFDELRVKDLRLVAHWDLIEKEMDNYDFTDLDWQLQLAQKNEAQVILAIGHRTPRWPECHWPDWSYKLSEKEWQVKVLDLLQALVLRYKDNPSIIAWQVENEPYLKVFGECPRMDNEFFEKEVALVKMLDIKPIVISESGELSTWLRGASIGDYVGTSIYRVTWNKHMGYFYYPLPPAYYYLKAGLVKFIMGVNNIFISEMQMEPWLGMPVLLTPLEKQYESMNLDRFKDNLIYAKRTGLTPIYFWGVEWWYWLKQEGNASIWNEAINLFNN